MTTEHPSNSTVNTGGGAYIDGAAHVGGDLVGRDKIINLTIGLLPKPRQLAQIAGVLIVIALSGYLAWWWAVQPVRMNGDFNIAIAEFVQLSDNSTDVATLLSTDLFDNLENEFRLGQLSNVQITHNNIGDVPDFAAAETIAEKTNAHLVIFGTVAIIGEQARLTPKFYVSERFRQDVGEINDTKELAMPLNFTITQVLDPAGISAQFRQRTTMLTQFVQGLVHAHTADYASALSAFEGSLAAANGLEAQVGKETLCLFASDAALRTQNLKLAEQYIRQALAIKPAYARAYIALANIYYMAAQLDEAQASYERALQLGANPDPSLIFEKAHLGIGNVYHNRGLRVPAADQQPYFAQAAEHFQTVIDSVQTMQAARQSAWELAAHAEYGLGRIHQTRGENAQAEQAYRQALRWTRRDELQETIRSFQQKL